MTSPSYSAAEPVGRLVEEFHKLPGIGPKTAQRLTYYLVRMPREGAKALAEAILAVKDRIVLCSQCYNITESDPCSLCTDTSRDQNRICIVEEALDVMSLERTGVYTGLYHVLHGVISPINGIGPENLKIQQLISRLKNSDVQEIIIATNPNMEGEATSMYIQGLLSPLGMKVTYLARGLPVGSDLEYADEVTLSKALEGRLQF